MPLQRSPVSVVKSIRQVSLARAWIRARGANALPPIAAFQPDERAGDALDLSIFKVAADHGRTSLICQQAGDRVRAIHGDAMLDRPLHACLVAAMAEAAAPIWEACLSARLPVYTVVEVGDAEGTPVTIEQMHLPYSSSDARPDFVVMSLHAWSTEGRFVSEGLLRVRGPAPPHRAVVLDPQSPARTASSSDDA